MMQLSILLFGILCFMKLPSSTPLHVLQEIDRRSPLMSRHNTILNNLFGRLLSQHDGTRNLQAFSTLNDIFSEITLVLPDSSISSNGLDLTISELTCSELSVQDIQVSHTSLSDTTKRISVNIIGLAVTCSFRWSYKWTIFNGSGGQRMQRDEFSLRRHDAETLKYTKVVALGFVEANHDFNPSFTLENPSTGSASIGCLHGVEHIFHT